jgi:hypothetical protein
VERASALIALTVVACAASASAQPGRFPALPPPFVAGPSAVAPSFDPSSSWDPYSALLSAETRATAGGRRVLETTRTMLDDGTVVRGSCFDWVDAVYHRAGGHWHDAFHGHGPSRGPYADASVLQPGDWVFFVNHEFGDDTHSAVFVAWADERAQTAVVASYAGGHRDEGGRFGTYTLTSVFRVVRMIDDTESPGSVTTSRGTRSGRRS